jgi:hypothetical protein
VTFELGSGPRWAVAGPVMLSEAYFCSASVASSLNEEPRRAEDEVVIGS